MRYPLLITVLLAAVALTRVAAQTPGPTGPTPAPTAGPAPSAAVDELLHRAAGEGPTAALVTLADAVKLAKGKGDAPASARQRPPPASATSNCSTLPSMPTSATRSGCPITF